MSFIHFEAGFPVAVPNLKVRCEYSKRREGLISYLKYAVLGLSFVFLIHAANTLPLIEHAKTNGLQSIQSFSRN